MAKDPRFNFYPDNYLGGTLGFTLEQHGAYLQLLILQSKLLQFTQEQAINHIATFYRGNYRGATELWQFLLPKFETDGTKFWNARLRKEMEKSKIHSQKQSERVKSRYSKNNGTTAVVPDNSIGIGNGNGIEEKGVQGETDFSDYERWTQDAISGNDHLFTNMLRGLKTHPRDQLPDLARSHLALLAKYPKMKPSDQNRFRISLIDHIAKELPHARSKTNSTTSAVIPTGKRAGAF